jgi:hypothetical protein
MYEALMRDAKRILIGGLNVTFYKLPFKASFSANGAVHAQEVFFLFLQISSHESP